ncbi:MAG: leucine--tRNA ligase [Candidatus Eremiobacterota bacterium]
MSTGTTTDYNLREIERRWKETWERHELHTAKDRPGRPNYYCLDMFPYPSGEGLHVGHWRGYVLSDVWSRHIVLKGFNVLHPMGWDAFGLPAENAAIKHGDHPQKYTGRSCANMKRQLREIGAMYDWGREINSSSPEYYRWTQWTFLKFFEKGLAYRQAAPVNWCPSCRTGLADEEVVDGACERCGAEVTKKYLPQWFYRITGYSQRLIDDLAELDWPEKVKKMQADWIGRSEGAEVDFEIVGTGQQLRIFTTRPDTLYGATFMVMAPEHPLVEKITTDAQRQAVEAYVGQTRSRSEVERQEMKEKTGVFTGGFAVNPVNGEQIPIWIADYVLLSYGTGAIMAVPGGDTRDWEFAKKFDLPIVQVVLRPDQELAGTGEELDRAYREKYPTLPLEEAYCGVGVMVNSGPYSGMQSELGKRKITEDLQAKGLGQHKVNYRLRDWLISRQRYWGAPIPIIHCEQCGEVPVPEKDLPVRLPHVESYQPSGTGESPLASIPEFVKAPCPKCGGAARRDTDTLSQWICSSWYYLRYVSPHNEDVAWTQEEMKKWLPVDMYVGGIEHAVLHLLYSRFYTKVFYDLGLVDFKEPFKRLFNQGMICRAGSSGRVEKMSKSKGNVVAPDTLVEKYGTDALRAYELFIGPPEVDAEWNDSGIEGVSRWLKRVWNLFTGHAFAEGEETDNEVLRWTHRSIRKVTEDLERLHLNTSVAALMEWLNFLIDKKRSRTDAIHQETVRTYLTLMAPIAPFHAEELWHRMGGQGLLFETASWPTWDEAYLREDEVEIVVQVNGKVRDKVKVPAAATREEIEKAALASEKVQAAMEGRSLKKPPIHVHKLINLVVG